MLPRPRRVRRSDEFRIVLRRGVRSASRSLVVHATVLDPGLGQVPATAGPTRVGFVATRAVGGSVVRHRVVRRLRALMAGRLPGLPDGLAIVVQALPASAEADSTQLGSELDAGLARCLGRLGKSSGTGSRGSQ